VVPRPPPLPRLARAMAWLPRPPSARGAFRITRCGVVPTHFEEPGHTVSPAAASAARLGSAMCVSIRGWRQEPVPITNATAATSERGARRPRDRRSAVGGAWQRHARRTLANSGSRPPRPWPCPPASLLHVSASAPATPPPLARAASRRATWDQYSPRRCRAVAGTSRGRIRMRTTLSGAGSSTANPRAPLPCRTYEHESTQTAVRYFSRISGLRSRRPPVSFHEAPSDPSHLPARDNSPSIRACVAAQWACNHRNRQAKPAHRASLMAGVPPGTQHTQARRFRACEWSELERPDGPGASASGQSAPDPRIAAHATNPPYDRGLRPPTSGRSPRLLRESSPPDSAPTKPALSP